MLSTDEVMSQLELLGSEQTIKIYRNHGADGPMFGNKVADLKKVLQKVRRLKDPDAQQSLALELWDTGNSDAMYLAALMVDGSKMTQAKLTAWARSAWWYMLSEYSVPFAASEHAAATKLASRWMDARPESVQSSGWATYAAALSVRDNDALDLDEITGLLEQCRDSIHQAKNRVRYVMNNFVIATATYVKPLRPTATRTANAIGKVSVDVGNTACKVNLATEAIKKSVDRNPDGAKRKTVKC